MLTLDDGSLVEGVVDLAFHENTPDFAGWTVVDFKTDREFEASSARYIAQVRVYSEAVGATTGSRCGASCWCSELFCARHAISRIVAPVSPCLPK